MIVVDGPWIASEHLLIVGGVLEAIILVALVVVMVFAIRADRTPE